MGKSAEKIDTIIVVAAVVLAAFVAGRISSNSRALDDAAFERTYASCSESVALEYRDKIRAEFRQAEREWVAKHTRTDGRSTRPCIDATSIPTMTATWTEWRPRGWTIQLTMNAASSARDGLLVDRDRRATAGAFSHGKATFATCCHRPATPTSRPYAILPACVQSLSARTTVAGDVRSDRNQAAQFS
jgi:hypothetical protein